MLPESYREQFITCCHNCKYIDPSAGRCEFPGVESAVNRLGVCNNWSEQPPIPILLKLSNGDYVPVPQEYTEDYRNNKAVEWMREMMQQGNAEGSK